jgi:hypothetical protein
MDETVALAVKPLAACSLTTAPLPSLRRPPSFSRRCWPSAAWREAAATRLLCVRHHAAAGEGACSRAASSRIWHPFTPFTPCLGTREIPPFPVHDSLPHSAKCAHPCAARRLGRARARRGPGGPPAPAAEALLDAAVCAWVLTRPCCRVAVRRHHHAALRPDAHGARARARRWRRWRPATWVAEPGAARLLQRGLGNRRTDGVSGGSCDARRAAHQRRSWPRARGAPAATPWALARAQQAPGDGRSSAWGGADTTTGQRAASGRRPGAAMSWRQPRGAGQSPHTRISSRCRCILWQSLTSRPAAALSAPAQAGRRARQHEEDDERRIMCTL